MIGVDVYSYCETTGEISYKRTMTLEVVSREIITVAQAF